MLKLSPVEADRYCHMSVAPRPPQLPRELAHELRSPLSAIVSAIDLILHPAAIVEESERQELLESARADALHLLEVFDRSRNGDGALRTRAVAAADVIRRALERFPSVEARAAVVVAGNPVMAADPGKIDQILTNLVQNVDRYAPSGLVELRAETVHGGRRVEVVCRDQGGGIARERAASVFQPRAGVSGRGLHIGLATSRRLAREMGGDLALDPPSTAGAVFRLTLPAAEERPVAEEIGRARAPRVRVMSEIAKALDSKSGQPSSHVESGVAMLARDVLGAAATRIFVLRDGKWESLGSGNRSEMTFPAEGPVEITPSGWVELLEVPFGLVVPLDLEHARAVMLLGFEVDPPWDVSDPEVSALAVMAGVVVERTVLRQDLVTERQLRSQVMESLPIAISIFAGDPPQVIDWNEAERGLLGTSDDTERPTDLEASQDEFAVRFVDGTPLTLENAPVVRAIRHGEAAGPFLLRIRRKDGSESVTRTYCAPFFDHNGVVAGAVVTSEIL